MSERLRMRLAAAVAESRWAPVFTNSLLCRFAAWAVVMFVRSLSGQASWLGRSVARMAPPSNFDDLIRVASESRLYGFVATGAAAFDAGAWQQSSVHQLIRRSVAPFDLAGRIRLVSWIWIVASMVHTALTWPSVSSRPPAMIVWSVLVTGLVAVWLLAPAIAARLSTAPTTDPRRDDARADSRFS